MAVIIGKDQPIEYHLATEEYLLKHYPIEEDILYVWYGSKAFVFGRNQNPYIEINPKYLLNDHIKKLRRISGGGTIYQDQGTLNITYITQNYKHKINDYQYFLNPIIKYLKNHQLNAYFKPKSHIFVDDYKISGNAQAFMNHRLMHHGTLLFDTDLSIINKALIDYKKEAHGPQVLSNKQPVKNLIDMVYMDKYAFLNQLKDFILTETGIHPQEISDIDQEKVKSIVEKRYDQWAWNFGHTPDFKIDVSIRSENVTLSIEKGIIIKAEPEGYKHLLGLPYLSEEYLLKK